MNNKKHSALSIAAGEKFLRDIGIPYDRQEDGSLLTMSIIDLSYKNLAQLPDLSCVMTDKSFYCQKNKLTSLIGAPLAVGGDFSCSNNPLVSLDGAPKYVGGAFWCDDIGLASLAGAPVFVGTGFWCRKNRLTTLIGSPASIGGNFGCNHNQLTSLTGMPASRSKDFYIWCDHNPLTSLEGTPQNFKLLISDLGKFYAWDQVPEELRLSPENRKRLRQKEALELEDMLRKSVVLQRNLPLPKKFRLY